MRWLLVGIMVVGFVLLDIAVIAALCNILGWTSIGWEMLVLLLGIGVSGMVAGLLGLRWVEKTLRKG